MSVFPWSFLVRLVWFKLFSESFVSKISAHFIITVLRSFLNASRNYTGILFKERNTDSFGARSWFPRPFLVLSVWFHLFLESSVFQKFGALYSNVLEELPERFWKPNKHWAEGQYCRFIRCTILILVRVIVFPCFFLVLRYWFDLFFKSTISKISALFVITVLWSFLNTSRN